MSKSNKPPALTYTEVQKVARVVAWEHSPDVDFEKSALLCEKAIQHWIDGKWPRETTDV